MKAGTRVSDSVSAVSLYELPGLPDGLLQDVVVVMCRVPGWLRRVSLSRESTSVPHIAAATTGGRASGCCLLMRASSFCNASSRCFVPGLFDLHEGGALMVDHEPSAWSAG